MSATTETLRVALERAAGMLAPHSQTARLDAEVLLRHVTGAPRHRPYAFPEAPLAAEHSRVYRSLVRRRARGEPVAYLTGEREFWSLSLEVTPDTLIPRPETELMVEMLLERVGPRARARIADLGTGAGPIALAIAHERPRCEVIASDTSARALGVARRNAERHALGHVEFRHGSWCEPLGGERLAWLVCNPPYVAEGDPHLARGDLRFEPRSALIGGGSDGLDAIRSLLRRASECLLPRGGLMLEHGPAQTPGVAALMRASGFADPRAYCDLAGRERVTVATRH